MRTSRTWFGILLFLAPALGGCGSMLRDMIGPAGTPTAVTVRCVQEAEEADTPEPPAPTPRARTR